MANRLASEKSPYLLQHADNPVDWFPWSDEAFQRAAEEDKPVFLSVGYATCHWCHVMAHECFEDEEVAKRLNREFVAIKVDREERPDVDQIYMTVCQAMTGRGGWPLSVFLTPQRKPFFAGTYFPKENRMGMPGFLHVLDQITELWKNQRRKIQEHGDQVTAAIQPRPVASNGSAPLDHGVLKQAFEQLRAAFDATWGGFGSAPKFPTPHQLTFLLRWYHRSGDPQALQMVEKSLTAMRHGGIFDQIGFGFHRYSVDERWLVPHFEKMLYDQAMLALAYTEAYQVTGKPIYRTVVREVFDYVLRDLTHPDGGFYCAEDADSEGREGLFYGWRPAEIDRILGAELGRLYRRFYDITEPGNFEDELSIPHISKTPEVFAEMAGIGVQALAEKLEQARVLLFEQRERRIHPLKDDKILTSWNGLMIAALAKGYQALGDPSHLAAARRAAGFIYRELRADGDRLYRRWRAGERAQYGFLDDYAFFVWGLLELYESSFEVQYLEQAVSFQNRILERFQDPSGGGFHYIGNDGERLIARDKEVYDGAIPSSNSVALLNLLRLARLTEDPHWQDAAAASLDFFAGLVRGYPMAYTQFLQALDFAIGPGREFVLVGDEMEAESAAMMRAIHSAYGPRKIVHWLKKDRDQRDRLEQMVPYLRAMDSETPGPLVYVCENYACREPVTTLAQLQQSLDDLGLSVTPDEESGGVPPA